MITLQPIIDIINEATLMKNAFFFTPPTSASARRAYEKYHSHPFVTWKEGNHVYTASFSVTCSCPNVYAKGHYTKDGYTTTLTTIKNSVKRMSDAQIIPEYIMISD